MASRVARPPVPPPPGPRRKQPPQPSLAALRARYTVVDRIGAGCAGTVVHALDKSSKLDVAVKIVPKNLLVDKSAKMALAREVSVLSKLAHPNIIDFSNAFEDPHCVYIATEFCPRGDLYHYLRSQPSGLHEREALKYLRQILKGLHYMHSQGISHRDIKLENVLMAPNGRVKLADFGMCYWRRPGGDKCTREHCGTPQYAAPEIMQRAPYVPEQGDMWACGVVLYAMLTRTLPFVGKNMSDLKRNIVKADISAMLDAPELARVSSATLHLLRGLWSAHPGRRPLPKQALELVDDALLGVKRMPRATR